MIGLSLMIVVAYLIGSIPFGVIVGRMWGFDPRGVGSGNIGMTNVARAGGGSAAAITFLGDVLKGAIPVAIARSMGFEPAHLAWVAVATFVGSIWSVFLNFRGGKGISAALGIWVVLAPMALLFAVAAFGTVLAIFRIMSLASIACALVIPLAMATTAERHSFLMAAMIISTLAILRHRENIQRLFDGTEPKLGQRKSGEAAAQSPRPTAP